MRGLLAVPLALAACAIPQVYVTAIGPLSVQFAPEVTIFNVQTLPDGTQIEPTPIPGGLVVRTLNGRAVPFEARDAALEAMQAHCLDFDLQTVPLYFAWRDVGDEGLWSAAGCEPAGGE